MRVEDAEEGDPSVSHAHLTDPNRLWPLGAVEYKWYKKFPHNLRRKLKEAMAYITENIPCVTFEPADDQSPNYVTIYPGTECSSEKGMRGGNQKITLNSKCFNKRLTKPVHELMHTLGFVHEHNRTLVLARFSGVPTTGKVLEDSFKSKNAIRGS